MSSRTDRQAKSSGAARLDVVLYAVVAIFVALIPVVFAPGLYDDFTLPKQALLLCTVGLCLVLMAFSATDVLLRDRLLLAVFAGLLVAATISFLLASDLRGSFFGRYQYREGYLSQFAMLVLFLAAVYVGSRHSGKAMLWAGLVGALGACAYAAVQITGNDPFDWWIDTSTRAIGTIGNANELAGFVLLAFAFGGALAELRSPWRVAGLTAFAAMFTFTLLATESRSGLYCAALLLLAFPVASVIVGTPRRELLRSMAFLSLGIGVGLLISLQQGLVQETFGRVAHTVPTDAQNEAAIASSTRLAIWRGTLPVIAEAPVFGHGPDGLVHAFTRARPEGLDGLFNEEDLPVQSSHNWFLDQAANGGFVGLIFLLALLSLVAYRSLRFERGRGSVTVPYIWAALVSYGALTMLNQLSIGVHAIFFLLLGFLAGRTLSAYVPVNVMIATKNAGLSWWLLRGGSGAICAGLFILASLSMLADAEADLAWGSSVDRSFVASAEQYGRASSLNPFEPSYLRNEAGSWLAAGACEGSTAYLGEAERKFATLVERFDATSDDLLNMAKARIALGAGLEGVEPLLIKARQLNPEGLTIDGDIQALRDASSLRNYVLVYREDTAVDKVDLLPVAEAIGLAGVSGCAP
jgi:O-antigen ligase